MRHALLLVAVLAWTTMVVSPSPALAEDSGGISLFDEIGHALFGKLKPSEPSRPVVQPSSRPIADTSSPPVVAERPAAVIATTAPARIASEEPQKPAARVAASDKDISKPVAQSPSEVSHPAADPSDEPAAEVGPSSESRPLPLHKRLTAFRESVFKSSSPTPAATTPVRPESATKPAEKEDDALADQDKGIRTPVSYGQPHLAPPRALRDSASAPGFLKESAARTPSVASTPAVATPNPPIGNRVVADKTANDLLKPSQPAEPSIDARAASPVAPFGIPAAEASPTEAANNTTSVADTLRRAVKQDATGVTAPSAKTANTEGASSAPTANAVLFSRQSPILSVETLGPRRITVGRQSNYEISIQNSGPVAANQVIVTVDLPDWADVAGAQASVGDTTAPTAGSPRQFRWNVGQLEAKGREKLVLQIVPRQNRPFDLAVKWDYTPVGSQTMIEVQEPKLAMQLQGPREVLYGKPTIFRLEIANTGNGAADNVSLALAPMGSSEAPPATHQFGTLAAGEKKAIEVELTARHTGTLSINVDASADGGIQAHLSEAILIRQASLHVSVEAPEVQFVGTQLIYRIKVSNPGNAPAQSVRVTATLPPEAEYVSSEQGGELGSDRRKVNWMSEALGAGKDTTFVLTTSLREPGDTRLEVLATADGELTASSNATTRVEAIANLAMKIVDPSGPVRVGDEAVYEIQVQNRGSKAAENVEIVTYFSPGIEPISAEGGRHQIGSGQVLFNPIPSIAAGQTLVLKVRARADTPGNLLFRAEVYCKPLGTRLVSEETTFFYGGPTSPAATASRSSSATASSRPESTSDAPGRLMPAEANPEARKPTPISPYK